MFLIPVHSINTKIDPAKYPTPIVVVGRSAPARPTLKPETGSPILSSSVVMTHGVVDHATKEQAIAQQAQAVGTFTNNIKNVIVPSLAQIHTLALQICPGVSTRGWFTQNNCWEDANVGLLTSLNHLVTPSIQTITTHSGVNSGYFQSVNLQLTNLQLLSQLNPLKMRGGGL